MVPEVEQAFAELAKSLLANPFDFLRENDVTCFLHAYLASAFPQRVPITLRPGIEVPPSLCFRGKLFTSRIHTEVKLQVGGKESCDLVVFQDRPYEVYPKSQGAVGGFAPPFLAAIEVKLAYGSRSNRFQTSEGVPADIAKLWESRGAFDHAYVVVVDSFEGRTLDTVKHALQGRNSVSAAYVGLDRFEVVRGTT